MQRIPMTVEGANQLREELTQRKFVDRPQIIEEIARAREHGDLKENAEYHAAREKQGFNEGRIVELESVLSNVQEIDVSKLEIGSDVMFGARVVLRDLENDEILKYQIVGPYEANLDEGKISVTSPIGKALIGKRVGDYVVVETPNKEKQFEIKEVSG